MKRQGIMAAFVEVHFNWDGRPRNLKIIRTAFFSKKDDPDSQITDPARLGVFRDSGLEKELAEQALKHTRGAAWLEAPRGPLDCGVAYVHLVPDESSEPGRLGLLGTYAPNQGELDRAAMLGDAVATRQLLAGGAARSKANQALGVAAAENSTLVLRMLLDSGADVNAGDKGGETPLMVAARLGKTANVRFLLAAGADVNVRTPGGETALLLAQAYHHREIADLLERTEAKSR